jgi:peptide/nickel transport system substrate-binding protein
MTKLSWKAAGVALVVASCEHTERFDASPPAERAARQEMIVAAGADEFGLRLNQNRLGMYPLNATICEPLVRLTKDFQIEPWLASRWEYRGSNTYRFTLRRGVGFHDGRPLDAASVKFSLDLAVRSNTQYSFLSPISPRAIDDSTIEIRPSLPNLRLLEQLVHPTYDVVAAGTRPSARPVCTGPFRFEEYVPQSHITVARNDSYWGSTAKLQRLTFRFMPDANTRALALRSGQVDAILDVSPSMIAGLKDTPGLRLVTAAPGAVILIYTVIRGPAPYTILADPAVRRAMAMAIDRKELVDHVLEGYASTVSTVNPPSALGRYAGRVSGIPYDPARAAKLLDSAGWRIGARGVRQKNGRPLALTMIVQSGAVDSDIAEYVQAQLAHAGIDVRIERLDAAAFESRIDAGTFDFDIEIPNQNDANPAFLLALRWYSRSNIKSARFLALGAPFDSFVESALATPDHGEAQRYAAEAMHVLVDEQAAAIPLAGIYRIYAMSNRVHGFDPHPSRINQWWNTVWLSR